MHWRVTVDEIDSESQSFIVRVWVEERAIGGSRASGVAILPMYPVANLPEKP
jgi:hypothetical protein